MFGILCGDEAICVDFSEGEGIVGGVVCSCLEVEDLRSRMLRK